MSDTAGSGFGKFVPGFEFLQNLASQATSGMAQGLGQSVPQMPNLGSWVAPTYNVEDIEKRIEELKAVHFWLDQNSKALSATIQALEVQKMTLSTLKNMNISIGDVASAIKARAAETFAGFTGGARPPPAPAPTQFAGLEIPPRTYGTPTPPPAEAPASEAPSSAPAAGVVDPMQWWGALSQQFQQIATHAMKDVAQQAAFDTTREVASGLTEQAVKTATDMADQVTRGLSDTVARHVDMATDMASDLGKAAASAASAVTPSPAAEPAPKPVQPKAKKAPARQAAAKAAAPKADTPPATSGEWTMPGAFFKVPGFSLTPAAAPPKPAAARKTGTQTAAKTTAKTAPKPAAKTPAKATAKAPTKAPAAAKKAAAKKPTGRGA